MRGSASLAGRVVALAWLSPRHHSVEAVTSTSEAPIWTPSHRTADRVFRQDYLSPGTSDPRTPQPVPVAGPAPHANPVPPRLATPADTPWVTKVTSSTGSPSAPVTAPRRITVGVPTSLGPSPLEPQARNALPAPATGFSGREREVAELLEAVDPRKDGDAGGVLVSAVSGMGGVGKTALTVVVGNRAVEPGWFSGALFVDLRGYSPDPVTPDQALESLLLGLGDAYDEAKAWHNLGITLAATGDEDGAVEAWERALALYEQTGESRHRAEVRARIAALRA
ncbi:MULTISPECIES: ATP-binding protein [unclassified Nocardiopsis]|uniref:ATP-binding protein n=1 Tax=Nocardiopsis TaxID=2013 RepID=UPI00387B216D